MASVHVDAIPFAGLGCRMGIYGCDGRGVAAVERGVLGGRRASTRSRQALCRSVLRWSRLVRRQAKLSTSVKYTDCSPRLIRDCESRQPTFETAVKLYRLVDAVKRASDDGREVTFE